jgi:hypothetical protein
VEEKVDVIKDPDKNVVWRFDCDRIITGIIHMVDNSRKVLICREVNDELAVVINWMIKKNRMQLNAKKKKKEVIRCS